MYYSVMSGIWLWRKKTSRTESESHTPAQSISKPDWLYPACFYRSTPCRASNLPIFRAIRPFLSTQEGVANGPCVG
ncbi:MAG: hypothetical protein JWL84_4382 [Rhodospirillales bacterium]|jgi:hypothetical protein|nr:hypothetical protein [Rhodospirillales bacterium]